MRPVMRYMYILELSFLNLLRSWRATVILSFMVVSAVASLIFLASLAIGTNDAMIRNSIGLFSGHISGSDISANRNTDILKVVGVDNLLLRKNQRFLLWTDDIYEPVLLMGVDPLQEKKSTALWKKTVSGRYLIPGDNGIFLNQETARILQVKVGDKVRLGRHPDDILKTFLIVGIYKTGISYLDQGLAFCPLEVFPAADSPATLAVFLHDGIHTGDILHQYKTLMPTVKFRDWPEFMPDLKQLIDLNFVCMALVMILVFAIVSVGISCAFLIFTMRNLREHGIMKAMGIMPADTALFITTQIGLLILFAATIGVLAGGAAVVLCSQSGIDLSALTSHNQYFSVSGFIYPRLTTASVFAAPLLAFIFGIGAAIWPSFYIIRKSPAEILRSV